MLLLDRHALDARRAVAAGPLSALADSLDADLRRLLPDGDVRVPPEKAKLTRAGGRCRVDGVLLLFNPTSPRRHRCPLCGREYAEEVDYLWWVMGYQLWLAERAVHAAALWALRGDRWHRRVFDDITTAVAERYLEWPNRDNVLGPTRPFFSTYLESIWLLQICVALDLVETAGGRSSAGDMVRDRLIEPSAALIASFDEGLSNRQAWNDAALAAAAAVLDRPALLDRALAGPSGLRAHLERGLLADGTWYEGENYHLFAHRALWYLVTQAAGAGASPPPGLVRRFDAGFVAPFLTALPDLTFPARRDSQYGVSLRQWRIAESCELGFARDAADGRLASVLGELYRPDVAAGDVSRWRSTAEAERNVPAARLTRADLGWKALLFAAADVPPSAPWAPESVLLREQGIGVLRRDGGRVYAALDYGATGGGHGHPDRLNLWLVHGAERVLEDVGTGSYVDPSLQWYRSTLAHNAPLVDGRSQRRVDGTLRAWEEQGDVGWMAADADIAPGVRVRRSLVVAPGYLVDDLRWSAPREVTLDLPVHVDAVVEGAEAWAHAPLTGAGGAEDGFGFVDASERASGRAIRLLARGARAWIDAGPGSEIWRAYAPGPPGSRPRRFLLFRSRGREGRVVSVWAWHESVHEVKTSAAVLTVVMADGTRHHHAEAADGWRLSIERAGVLREVLLGGLVSPAAPVAAPGRALAHEPPLVIPRLRRVPADVGELSGRTASATRGTTLQFRLGRAHYRRSEESWEEAGAPEARVALGATEGELLVEVTVRKPALAFAPPVAENPLDNEHPDVNSDGVQLHLASRNADATERSLVWLLVPEPGGGVRVSARADAPRGAVSAGWRRTRSGYRLLARVSRSVLGPSGVREVGLDVIINETAPGRERRRGQLVLSGARDEWVYLRGDRQDPDRLLTIRLADG